MLLLAIGMPVAFSFLLVNVVGAYFFWGGIAGFNQLAVSIVSAVTKFALIPAPLFILMGELLAHSRIMDQAIDALDGWIGRLPGRLALLSVAVATLSSTLSGSSLATTAMLGELLVPEMERRGYKKSISLGCVMSGGLAMIIPPSALAVILGSIGEISVAGLLIAGVIPGLVMASLYITYIIGRCYIQPSVAPSYAVPPKELSEKIKSTVRYVLPLGIIMFLVVGVIIMGVATPTEASATGAVGCFILIGFQGRLNWAMLKKSFFGTLHITAMLLMIVAGSTGFSQLLAFTGASKGIVEFVTSLSVNPILVLLSMQFSILLLGCFMEQVSIMMITLPIFMPLVHALGFSDVWFGIMMLINIEVGMKTPPFGLLIFVMKGVARSGTTTGEIIRSVLPFIICDVLVILLIMLFPALALWLPGKISR
jgi:tripartite ATP-independent transporter DctM subunit